VVSAPVLVLPGYADSGPDHWQSHWERDEPACRRVAQDDWLEPKRQDWLARLDRYVAECAAPPVLIAHSLGCALVAHCAQDAIAPRIAGALLVAPPDVDEVCHLLPEIETFAPMPTGRLPFRSIVVSSTDDPYVEPPRARAFAAAWGARLVELAGAGHINADSNLGDWPAGHRLLEELLVPGTRGA